MNEEPKSLIERIASIDKRFAWSFIGVVLALLFGAIGIYSTFFYSSKPNLKIEKTSETDVIKLSEDISNLEILYDSTSIKESQKNLRILSFRVINKGNKSITENSYASTHPILLKIEEGEVVQTPEIIDASNKYLKDFESLSYDSTLNQILLPPVIIENGEYYILKFLVLHDSEKTPTYKVSGKIEGQNILEITDIELTEEAETNISPKKLALIILSLLIFLFLAYLLNKAISRNIKYRRENKLAHFLMKEKISLTPEAEKIINTYLDEKVELDNFIEYMIRGFKKSEYEGINSLEKIKDYLKNNEIKKIHEFTNEYYKISEDKENLKKLYDVQIVCYLLRNKFVNLSSFDENVNIENIKVIEKFIEKNRKKKQHPTKHSRP